MEGGMKGYWKKQKPYQRLDGSGRRRMARAELGGDERRRRRRFWRIKISPRLKLLRRAVSPRRIVGRMRDAYVRMMLAFAGSGVFSGGQGYVGVAASGFGRSQMAREYDEKALVEMYRSIVAQGRLFADAGGGGIELGLRR